jgi:hypothetical protein
MLSRMRIAAVLISVFWFASAARAQPSPLSPVDVARLDASHVQPGPLLTPDALREELTKLRLDKRDARRTAGWWLLGWGAASAVGGGAVAIIEHHHQAWLAAGITTAGFGVINALLAPSLMDLSSEQQRGILAEKQDPHSDFVRIRENELVADLMSGQTFAYNAGLDLFYISAGLLVYALGHDQRPRVSWEEGSGLALASQGLPLLVFDIANWLAANRRADAISGMRF